MYRCKDCGQRFLEPVGKHYTIKLHDKYGNESECQVNENAGLRQAFAIAAALSLWYSSAQVVDEAGHPIQLTGPAWEEEAALADINLKRKRKHGRKAHSWQKYV